MKIAVLLGDPDRAAAVVPGVTLGELDRPSFDALREALAGIVEHTFVYLTRHATLIDDLRRLDVELALNLCDEGFGNDLALELHVPALLELLGVPYTGSGPRCLACCFDKALVRSVAADLGIAVARGGLSAAGLFPAIVKPNFGDGSFGITERSVVHDADERARAVAELRAIYAGPILIEEYLPGPDVDVGAIATRDGWTLLPFATVDYSRVPAGAPHIECHDFKWLDVSRYARAEIRPITLAPRAAEQIRAGSVALLDRLGCRGYARLDWRLDAAGAPRLLEVNPNTGWGASGRLAEMAAMAGIGYADLLRAIIDAAAL